VSAKKRSTKRKDEGQWLLEPSADCEQKILPLLSFCTHQAVLGDRGVNESELYGSCYTPARLVVAIGEGYIVGVIRFLVRRVVVDGKANVA
jgi:hypothetical protein